MNIDLKVVERGIIYADADPNSPTRIACYPSLTRLEDGRIVCGFRVGSGKDSPDATLRVMQSRDSGASWERLPFAPDATLNGVQGALGLGHLIETSPGQLLLAASWANRSQPDLPISHPETGGCLELRAVTFSSTDGGATWSEAQIIDSVPFEQPEISGPPLALSKPGHLLLPMENQKFYDDPDPIDEKAYALLSFDGGKSWPEWAMIAYDHPARKFWCNRVAKLPSGKLVCVSWTFDNATERDLPLHLIYGSPDGKEWSTPVSTGIDGQVSYLLPLDESTLLMSTSHRKSPAGIRLRTSFDGGSTWDGDGMLVFDAENQASQSGGDLGSYYQLMTDYTFGWSPMVRLDDGSILLAHFSGDSQAIAVHWVRIGL